MAAELRIMTEPNPQALEAYLNALAERDGALAALEFLPAHQRVECEARIHELNADLELKAADLGRPQLDLYRSTLDARRHNVADLIAHLERMRPHVAKVPAAAEKLEQALSESIGLLNFEGGQTS